VPPEHPSECPRASRFAPTSGSAFNEPSKDTELEVIGEPDRPHEDRP
jgi:hypothetical protein